MSESKTLTVCYTDIKGSSDLNNKIGNEPMAILKTEHFRVEKELISRNGGVWCKNLGDGSLSTFDNPADAIKFLSEFQWLEAKHPGLEFWTFETKSGLAHGEVTLTENQKDISGGAADLANRILSESSSGKILLENNAYQALGKQLGRAVGAKYCRPLGKRDLKDYRNEEIWEFDWRQFIQDQETIGDLVEKHLNNANFVLHNTVPVPISKPGYIFWPVVPRPINAIHKGQLEAIKVLSFCGWETCLFIADSDHIFDATPVTPNNFEEKIRAYAKNIGVSLKEIKYLSRVFDVNSTEFPSLLSKLKELTKDFRVKELFGYEGKSYQDRRALVMERTILNFLRTIFTLVAFQHFLDNHTQPVMIISGVDELPKWKNYLEKTPSLSERVNVICNPELKRGGHLIQQDLYQPIWRSKHEFIQATKETNLSTWAFDLFVCLPQFPRTEITICNQFCKKDACEKKRESCGEVNKLADRVADVVKDRLEFV